MQLADEPSASERKQAAQDRTDAVRLLRHNQQLTALLEEFESFSSSVAHDLRSPLRSIAGYAEVVEQDYGHLIEESGRKCLSIIRTEALRMGGLVDGLVSYAQLRKRAMDERTVNMTALANDVASKLNNSGASVLEIGELPPAHGDTATLRLVWEHLIGNAIKFTGREKSPLIRISGSSAGAESIYEIADNGVGFDMDSAGDKLFAVFERQHHDNEFPGTGMGLASVFRIVRRHHGRVWATGAVGQGATFSFALPAGER
ncbi:MAG: hypothetical protein QOF71_1177 [Candidatus Eremiobacteraeota bacterium]|jgi:light-regulated signal transduction histidine kinase (bacteriophytochrome)|nr:hypothetical protein [Candidatus Eremiobacteraeota bacterium]